MKRTYDPFDPGEYVDEPGCEAFEIALEMRVRGALAASAVPVLEAHLAACASCRAYAARSARVDAALAPIAIASVDDARIDAIQRRMRAGVRRYRRRTPLVMGSGLVGGIAIATAEAVAFKSTPAITLLWHAAVVFVLGGVFAGFIYVRAVRRQRAMLDATDVLAAYRGALERSLRASRLAVPLMLLMAGLALVQLVDSARRVLDGFDDARGDVTHALILIGCGMATVIAALVDVRRVRRELAELR